MKCITCGRDMLDQGTHYECSNILCDYEEEVVDKEIGARLKRDLQCIVMNKPEKNLSLNW